MFFDGGSFGTGQPAAAEFLDALRRRMTFRLGCHDGSHSWTGPLDTPARPGSMVSPAT